MSSSGRRAVAGDEQRDAGLDRDPLGVGAVADHDDVAGLEAERERLGRHREHPHAAADLVVALAHELLALEHGGDRADRRRRVELATPRATRGRSGGRARARSSRRRARLPSSTIGTRSTSSRAMIRPTSRTGSPCSASGNRSRITSRTRSITCGSSGGSSAPLRSSTQRVCAFSSPSRTGTYSLRGSSRPLELGVADRRRDRVGVGIAVAGDVDARHARMIPHHVRQRDRALAEDRGVGAV